jgi:hypothetical protein
MAKTTDAKMSKLTIQLKPPAKYQAVPSIAISAVNVFLIMANPSLWNI